MISHLSLVTKLDFTFNDEDSFLCFPPRDIFFTGDTSISIL